MKGEFLREIKKVSYGTGSIKNRIREMANLGYTSLTVHSLNTVEFEFLEEEGFTIAVGYDYVIKW